MEDSTAILSHITLLKNMLDQVNEEIGANIQVTREIESEIVKCSETEKSFASRESELTKALYASQFEISGLLVLHDDSRNSVDNLDKKLGDLKTKRDEALKRINEKHEGFVKQCLEFQREIENNDELRATMSEKEFLENEFRRLEKENNLLKTSMQAFMEEILDDLHGSNCGLQMEIERGNEENQKLVNDIEILKTKLLSAIIIEDDNW